MKYLIWLVVILAVVVWLQRAKKRFLAAIRKPLAMVLLVAHVARTILRVHKMPLRHQ